MTTRYDDMIRAEDDMETRTARRINLDDTATGFPPHQPQLVCHIPINVGSIVSLRGFQINPSSHEYAYPIMTVYDIFNKDRCRCYWYVNGVQQEAIYGMEILINRG